VILEGKETIKMKHIYLIVLLSSTILLFLFSSCEIINPSEQVPAYISVDTIQLLTDNNVQGSSEHGFSDCWLYINNELIGIFEVPFTVPVLHNDDCDILIQAGIKNNGSQSTRVVYPFVTSYNTTANLKPNEDHDINPIFEYDEDVVFALKEDFEDLGISFEVSEESDTVIQLVSDDNAQEGTSMAFSLDDQNSAFECKTSELFVLPQGSRVFAEISFKCTDNFQFGVFARKYSGGAIFEERIPIITLYKTEEWKTVYVELTSTVANEINTYDYRLYFTCVRSDNATNTETEVFIDNFKLLHY
jgi:hypothetical protein